MTRPQSEPMGIGVPSGEVSFRQVHCPGATLRVTRPEYLVMRRDGQVWVTGPDDIRHDGLSDARVFCRDDVALIRAPQGKRDEKRVFAIYHSALCGSCAELERINRKGLAERFAGR